MPARWVQGEIVRIVDEGPKTKRFWLKTESALEFKAGQFITADLPIHEKRNKRWRSYSIANIPSQENGLIELCIVKLEDGAASHYLFEEAEIGTSIDFKGPAGNFVLPTDLTKDLVLICTGTGVAPFRSMLLELDANDSSCNTHLIFGTRNQDGILYRDEFELRSQSSDFRYDIALSRESEWPGYRGYVHQIYEKEYAEVRPDVLFYVCGWSMMVDDATARLLDMGYDRQQIRFELYG